MRPTALLAIGLLTVTATACEDDPRPPIAPGPHGGTGVGGGGGGGDAGSGADGGADAGPGATGFSCLTIPPGDTDNIVRVSGEASPIAFTATRAFLTWNGLLCDTPTLLLTLSEGSCTPGAGRRLSIQVVADDIGTIVRTGPNVLGADAAGSLSVVFVEPATDDGFDEVWGDCAGASGDVTFDALDATPGARLAGSIDATLTDCDDPAIDPPLRVTGDFDVVLGERVSDVCP